MRALDLGRYALSLWIAATVAGCGGLQAPFGGQARAGASGGWMLREAKGEDLLYLATGENLYVWSYPGGKLTGIINTTANNICSDEKGDVYVPQGYQVVEFARGGSNPIRTLADGDLALGCAVDPTTGNLAVTNEGSGAGEVAIFPNAKEPVQWYRDPEIGTYGLCGYDDRGNLFFDGTSGTEFFPSGGNYFAELPKGSSTFANYVLSGKFDVFGSVQWDGRYITLSNPSTQEIYRLKLSNSSLKIAGTTHVRGWQNGYSGRWPYIQTWLKGNTFIAQSSALLEVGLWPYPRGGTASKVIGPFKSGTTNIYGITISVAK